MFSFMQHGLTELQAAFLVHTTWKLAEGVCAVNYRPVPSSTLM